ncbi:hypothetical protein EDD86DRAFT_196542 [Gorgonomyces haynaldii]|nr:hypothetical protein EDD86DRAFT_196542 [Gorgonomyces haynaldii]
MKCSILDFSIFFDGSRQDLPQEMILTLLQLVAAQAPSSTVATSAPAPSATCDPYNTVCAGVSCALPGTGGLVRLASPNTTAYFYVGQPINITWTYSDLADPQYPTQSVNIYYRQVGTDAWTSWVIAPPKSKTAFGTINNVAGGNYQVVVVPDNIDVTGGLKAGKTVSCVHDQWPYPGTAEFRLLVPFNVQPYTNPLPANTNAGYGLSLSPLLGGLIVSAVCGLALLLN